MNQSIERILEANAYEAKTKGTVICEFCNKECSKDTSRNNTPYWRCSNHSNVIIKYLVPACPDTWYTKIIVCKYKERVFHVCFFYYNTEIKEKFRIDQVDYNVPAFNSYQPPESAKTIFTLDFHPQDITADNVIGKISKWIIFS